MPVFFICLSRMYAATASGAVYQINIADRRLECIYQLHNGPIYSIAVNEGMSTNTYRCIYYIV